MLEPFHVLGGAKTPALTATATKGAATRVTVGLRELDSCVPAGLIEVQRVRESSSQGFGPVAGRSQWLTAACQFLWKWLASVVLRLRELLR